MAKYKTKIGVHEVLQRLQKGSRIKIQCNKTVNRELKCYDGQTYIKNN